MKTIVHKVKFKGTVKNVSELIDNIPALFGLKYQDIIFPEDEYDIYTLKDNILIYRTEDISQDELFKKVSSLYPELIIVHKTEKRFIDIEKAGCIYLNCKCTYFNGELIKDRIDKIYKML